MSMLRRYERAAQAQSPQALPGKSPAAFLDTLTRFFDPEPVRMRAARGTKNEQLPVLDDPSVQKIERMLLALQDEHGTIHIAFVGKWDAFLLKSLQEYPAVEKWRLKMAELRRVEREKYEREYPVACAAKDCGKRFKTSAGLNLHIFAMRRRGENSFDRLRHAALGLTDKETSR